MKKRQWNFSQSNAIVEIAPNNIILTGAPIFLKDISTADPAPLANFTYTLNTSCAPYSITFNDNSTNNPTTWNWSFPGGTPLISNEQNPTITYANEGSFIASLIASNDSGNDAVNNTLDLGTNLTYELNQELCFGDEIIVNGVPYNESNPNGTEVLINGSVDGCDSTVIIQLTFDDALESFTAANICDGDTYPFGGENLSMSGIYTFETSTASGCDSTANLTLTVEISTTESYAAEICAGEEYIGVQYFEDTIITEIISSNSGCDSLIIVTALTVKPVFNTPLDITILEGESYTIGTSTYTESGFYTDVLTAQNGCDSTIQLTLTVDMVEAVNNFSNPASIDLQCFPNPFSKIVNISFLSKEENFIGLEVFDSNGKRMDNIIRASQYVNGKYLFSLKIENQSQGVYWCRIQLQSGIFTQRLILIN